MEQEKQIEEMANDIPNYIVAYDRNPAKQRLYIEQRTEIAEHLIKKGYRKERQGEWIINKSKVEVDIYCSKCNYQYTEADPCNYELYNYCPNCGSKMKGAE